MVKFLNGVLLTAIIGILIYIAVVDYDCLSYFSLEAFGPYGGKLSEEEFIKEVNGAMLQGENQLVLNYSISGDELKDFVTTAIEEAFLIDSPETSSDYDYLRFKYAGVDASIRGFGRSHEITYNFNYLESKQQTDIVDQKVENVLKEMDIEKQSNYDKIKLIHDYIVVNCSYDLSTKKNSAYACLVERYSACQGYATLTYKMMVEAGIPCRVISGKGLNESHAWNIVQLNGEWYNLDCTWDDPIGQHDKDFIDYEFFLKNEKDFKQHVRDSQYDTPEFHEKHKMATKSY